MVIVHRTNTCEELDRHLRYFCEIDQLEGSVDGNHSIEPAANVFQSYYKSGSLEETLGEQMIHFPRQEVDPLAAHQEGRVCDTCFIHLSYVHNRSYSVNKMNQDIGYSGSGYSNVDIQSNIDINEDRYSEHEDHS